MAQKNDLRKKKTENVSAHYTTSNAGDFIKQRKIVIFLTRHEEIWFAIQVRGKAEVYQISYARKYPQSGP